MKLYLEITISANEEQRELLLPTMMELGCTGFQETNTHLISYIDKSDWSQESTLRFENALHSILRTISANAEISMQDVPDRNWNLEWEKTIQPIEVGTRFTIKPSWADYPNEAKRIIIQIDPKMSFGTGYHETTRLIMGLLERYVVAGRSLLDVGTGTGILAICAVKLGCSSAVGIDNDEWSIENALENVANNSVAEKVRITSDGVGSFPPASFDLIASNITLNTNLDFLPEYSRILKPRGTLLLSGLLRADEDAMVSGLLHAGFNVTESAYENEWVAIVAQV